MIEIHLEDGDFKRGLSQLLRNATHTAPMMRGIAQELENLTKDNFATESWGGKKWKRSNAADAKNRKTLYDSGELHDSITTQSGQGYARIGSNMKYAAIHHFGGRAGRNRSLKLPARPYLPINAAGKLQNGGEDALLQIAVDALASGV